MNNSLAPPSALNQEHPTDFGPPVPLAPFGRMLSAALLELDLEAAKRLSRRVGPLTNIVAHSKERAATKRANRSTLNDIAASLGVSRSTLNRILEEPPPRAGERDVEPAEKGGDGKRHHHGAGRRRHTGAGGRRHTGVGVVHRRGRVRTA